MTEIVMRLKSGREFRFKCEEYTIKTFKPTGTLSEFSYKGGVGECPIYFQEQDIECIAIIGKEQIEELKQEPSEDCISREWLVEEIARRDTTDGYVKVFGGREVNEIILNAPSVAPKHGRWIDDDPTDHKYHRCSCCGIGDFNWGSDAYCRNCGVKMIGKEF